MVTRRPSVMIYSHGGDEDFIREIRAGIEEEGVFSEVVECAETDVDRLASDAARDSMLGSGIGISGEDAAFTMLRLSIGKNIMKFHMPTYRQCRDMGANSARAVKKLGFRGL